MTSGCHMEIFQKRRSRFTINKMRLLKPCAEDVVRFLALWRPQSEAAMSFSHLVSNSRPNPARQRKSIVWFQETTLEANDHVYQGGYFEISTVVLVPTLPWAWQLVPMQHLTRAQRMKRQNDSAPINPGIPERGTVQGILPLASHSHVEKGNWNWRPREERKASYNREMIRGMSIW